jgi:hypothetical protein
MSQHWMAKESNQFMLHEGRKTEKKERKKEEEEEECAGSSYRLRRIISLTFVRKKNINIKKKKKFQEKYKLVFFLLYNILHFR